MPLLSFDLLLAPVNPSCIRRHSRSPRTSSDASLISPQQPAQAWEIDASLLMIEARVACGAYSNLYSGTYRGQRVAVKVLKEVGDDASQQAEFLHVSRGPAVSGEILRYRESVRICPASMQTVKPHEHVSISNTGSTPLDYCT